MQMHRMLPCREAAERHRDGVLSPHLCSGLYTYLAIVKVLPCFSMIRYCSEDEKVDNINYKVEHEHPFGKSLPLLFN